MFLITKEDKNSVLAKKMFKLRLPDKTGFCI